MSEETRNHDETPCLPQEVNREARRLERLRLVVTHDLPRQDEPLDDFDPDPKEAA
jgi:hypothetical protein